MSIIVPTEYEPLIGNRSIVRRQSIVVGDIDRLTENAHHAYANGGIRSVLQLRNLNIGGYNSYTTIGKVRFTFGAQRELSGLRFAYSVTNVDLQVRIRNTSDAGTGATKTVTSATTGDDTVSAPGGSYTDCIVEVRAKYTTATTATLHFLRVWEKEHTASTLPG